MVGVLNIQIKPIIGKKDINLKKIEHFIKKNSDKNLDIVVLPEFFSTGIDYEEFINSPMDENGGDTIDFIKELAIKYNTNIVAGTVIEKCEENLYNTSFVIDRNGKIIDKYRKIHLYNYLGGTEGQRITPGDREVVVNLDICKIGLGICYDIRYPLHYKKLAQAGAQIIILPTAWIVQNEIYNDKITFEYARDMWIAMNRTRAYDNMVYIISSNLTKNANEKVSAIGSSLIVSPLSEIIASAKNEETALYCDIDVTIVDYLKQIYPIASID